MKPYILGAIFARGGSKGILHKNTRLLSGKPLIAYAIEAGLSVPLIDKLIVSTDDEQIAAISKKFGASVPFIRPAQLAEDNSPELLSWQHAIRTMEEKLGNRIDMLVSIPTTSPLRLVQDIENCINKLLANDDTDIVITVTQAQRNPYFNMVLLDSDDNAHVVVSKDSAINRRQDAPVVYDVTTVAYAARVQYILNTDSILKGKVKAIVVPVERALDIDTELDFEVAQFLMDKKRKK